MTSRDYENEVLVIAQGNRSLKERCELLAPIVRYMLDDVHPDDNISTRDLCQYYLMPDAFENPLHAGEKKIVYAVLRALAKGELRNWRKHSDTPNSAKYYGKETYPNIWFDAKFNAHPTNGLDPAARIPAAQERAPASSLPERAPVQPLTLDSYPYEEALQSAFDDGTIALATKLIELVPQVLADKTDEIAFGNAVDILVRRTGKKASPLRSAIYDLMRVMSTRELEAYCTARRMLGNGREMTCLLWHCAKNTLPALTE